MTHSSKTINRNCLIKASGINSEGTDMTTKMNDERGCSVCVTGSENCEFFTTRLGRKVYHRMQYDYRHTDGELFSCIGNDLESCRKCRDEWLSRKEVNG